MGAKMMMKVIDREGNEKFVALTGAEKAMIYRMFANFGIYEREVPPEELSDEEKKDVFSVGRPEDRKAVTETPTSYSVPRPKVNTSTMHCCEASEMIFEDIS